MKARLILLLCVLANLAIGARVWVTWFPNPETDIAGYRIFYGTNSRDYQVVIDVGNVTNTVVSNLTAGITWYFAATAYNTSGLESDLSEEATCFIPSLPTPPINLRINEN